MSNNTFPPVINPDPLEQLFEEYRQREAERDLREAELLEDREDLPEISPETEAAFLAQVETNLDERYGPKKG